MALQVCKDCTTAYAPAARCPNCGGEEWVSELAALTQDAPAGPPPVSAPKADWVAHAAGQGDIDAAAKTKAQLIEDHGPGTGLEQEPGQP